MQAVGIEELPEEERAVVIVDRLERDRAFAPARAHQRIPAASRRRRGGPLLHVLGSATRRWRPAQRFWQFLAPLEELLSVVRNESRTRYKRSSHSPTRFSATLARTPRDRLGSRARG